MAISRNRQGRWALVALLAVAALAPALGGGSASGATASGVKTVDIANFAFHPPTLRIARGTKVTFANSSDVTHTATRAGSFDTGRIKAGTSAVVKFDRPGSFAYHCKIHPFMKGRIVVE